MAGPARIAFWAPVIRALREAAPDFRVVAYDQRGHGESEIPGNDVYSVPILVEDLRAVLDATAAGQRAGRSSSATAWAA